MVNWDAVQRTNTLTDYGLMDSGREQPFETIVAHAAQAAGAPISTISLIDDTRQWFKAKVGIDHDGSPIGESLCAHVIAGNSTLVVNDTTLDRRFRDLPPVVGDPGIRFYAGAPLKLRNGVKVGTLCVIDVEPRDGFDEEDRHALESLARRTVAAIEMRQRARIRFAFQGNLGSLQHVLLDEARTALLTASAALEQVGDLLPLALLDEVIALVDDTLDGSRPCMQR